MAGSNQFVVFFWFQTFFWNTGTQQFGTRLATQKKTQLKLTIWGGTQKFPKLLQKIYLK